MLLRNRPILVLDEATSALGNETERAVQAALDELASGGRYALLAGELVQ
jgi:ATP-binding cassette, subfamily B, bacterial